MLPKGQLEQQPQSVSPETSQPETQEPQQEEGKETPDKEFGELNGKIDALTQMVSQLMMKENGETE